MMLMFLITSCSINTPKTNNDSTDNNVEENAVEIDRSEYLTGEIITDGNYDCFNERNNFVAHLQNKTN